MNINDIQLLFEYDRWANNRVFAVVSTLTVEQFTRDLGGSFPSVRDTLLHIISGEWGWLAFWKGPCGDPSFVKNLRERMDALFNPLSFSNVGAVQSRWAEVDQELADFVNSLTNERLEEMLPVRGTQVKLMHLMHHVANHSTYHRGQITQKLRQLGAQPVATDFHVFAMERSRQST